MFRSIFFLLALLLPSLAVADPIEDCRMEANMEEKLAKCGALLAKASLSDGQRAVALSNVGIAYDELGHYEEALKYYDLAVETDPTYAAAYNNRGITYRNLERDDDAFADYSKAIELDRTYAAPLNNRALIYKDRNQYEAALKDLDEAVRIDPEYKIAYNSMGTVLMVQERYLEAIAILDYTIVLFPDYARAYQNRASSYRSLGEHEKAVEDWIRALELFGPDTAISWKKYMLGRGLIEEPIDGALDDKLRAALMACAKDPDC